jgi:hypothetical protein
MSFEEGHIYYATGFRSFNEQPAPLFLSHGEAKNQGGRAWRRQVDHLMAARTTGMGWSQTRYSLSGQEPTSSSYSSPTNGSRNSQLSATSRDFNP